MRRFVSRTLLFLAPIILVAYPLDWILSETLLEANGGVGELEVVRDIYNGNANCEMAVYGSSRAWVHFNAQLMQDSLRLPVYNFGTDGHNFRLQYLRHLEYLKHNQKPLAIIMSVDAFTLQRRTDLYQSEQFLPIMLWNTDVYDYTHDYKGFDRCDYFVPLVRYAGQAQSLKRIVGVAMGTSPTAVRHKGFAGRDLVWNDDLEKAQANKEKYTIRFDSPTINLFERFLQECDEQDITVILVYTPEYIDGQHFIANRDVLMQYYRKTARKNGIHFLDFSQDAICFDQSLFYNANHLNSRGADAFTQKLIIHLKTILSKKEQNQANF